MARAVQLALGGSSKFIRPFDPLAEIRAARRIDIARYLITRDNLRSSPFPPMPPRARARER